MIWDRQWERLLSDPDTEKQLGVFSVKVMLFRHKRSRKAPSTRKSLSRHETLPNSQCLVLTFFLEYRVCKLSPKSMAFLDQIRLPNQGTIWPCGTASDMRESIANMNEPFKFTPARTACCHLRGDSGLGRHDSFRNKKATQQATVGRIHCFYTNKQYLGYQCPAQPLTRIA